MASESRSDSKETDQNLQHCRWQCYPNTAHLFPWEIPDQVLEDIERWLGEHPEIASDRAALHLDNPPLRPREFDC